MRTTSLAVAVLAGSLSVVSARPAFSGNFVLSNVVVYSPFQANSSTTSNSSIACKPTDGCVLPQLTDDALTVDFSDQDVPDEDPIRCLIEWAVGLPPPEAAEASFCSDSGVHVWFPADTYHGVKNFRLALTHTYEDDR